MTRKQASEFSSSITKPKNNELSEAEKNITCEQITTTSRIMTPTTSPEMQRKDKEEKPRKRSSTLRMFRRQNTPKKEEIIVSPIFKSQAVGINNETGALEAIPKGVGFAFPFPFIPFYSSFLLGREQL
jgi:hypothetical protein